MARVQFKSVVKRWGEAVAVDGVSLDIADGEFIAVLGPSGCGKSTTLLMLAGIYAPTEGDILFDGARVNEVEARDRNVGVVFQSYALYPHMTVRENIAFPLRFAKTKRPGAVEEAAALVQISDLLDRRPAQLSGGQQQRVALARALAKEPRLLLLDEPLSNLDASLRLTMRGEIRRLHRRLKVTTILVTHDQIEATTMADRIVCMNRGRVEQIGTAEDLYRRPDTLFVASFLGSPPINLLEGDAQDGAIRVGETALPMASVRGPIVLGLRPEHIRLDSPTGMIGRVAAVEPMGREALVSLETPLGLLRAVEPAGRRRAEGEESRIAFDEADLLIFDKASGRRLRREASHDPVQL